MSRACVFMAVWIGSGVRLLDVRRCAVSLTVTIAAAVVFEDS